MVTNMDLTRIADVMRCDLTVLKGKVDGSVAGEMSTAIRGLRLPVHGRAVAMFDYDQTGVLFKMMGDLYVMVAHNPGGATTAYIIDAHMCIVEPEKMIEANMTLAEVVKMFGAAIIHGFIKQTGRPWSHLKLEVT